jgi:hypothetical protein
MDHAKAMTALTGLWGILFKKVFFKKIIFKMKVKVVF